MAWSRPRFVFRPTGEYAWSRTHAQVPTALVLDDKVRVFYATRDDQGRSLTGFVDLDLDDLSRIIYVHKEPVLGLGRLGTHDEDGVMVGAVVADANRLLMYYTGWSRGKTVPYRVSVGLAASMDGGFTFERLFEGPILDRTPLEPYMTMSPSVLPDPSGLWHMWYGSGIGWIEVEDKIEPLYVVKYAESRDGLTWVQPNLLCIRQQHPLEANTRPSVIRNLDGYEMWFSYRHSRDFRDGAGAYRMGHAISVDGKVWTDRSDPDDLKPSGSEWIANMAAYPNVVEVKGRRIMFLNGNGFGRSGFGYVVHEGGAVSSGGRTD